MNMFNYFPTNYNPYQQQMQMAQMQQQLQNQQNINTLFMRSKTVDEARNYPVAPGTTIISVTDDAQHCCIKSLGTSPFDTPVFNEYDNIQNQQKQNEVKQEIKEEIAQEAVEYATKKELNSYIEQFNIIGNNFAILKNENEKMRSEINKLKQELGIEEGAQNATD